MTEILTQIVRGWLQDLKLLSQCLNFRYLRLERYDWKKIIMEETKDGGAVILKVATNIEHSQYRLEDFEKWGNLISYKHINKIKQTKCYNRLFISKQQVRFSKKSKTLLQYVQVVQLSGHLTYKPRGVSFNLVFTLSLLNFLSFFPFPYLRNKSL